MFALDLFNTDHERRLAEGAVDRLEQRRIDDLAMKMDDLVARARTADTPAVKAALMKEFQKCKAERDSYFKIKDECMGYGTLVGEETHEFKGAHGKMDVAHTPGKTVVRRKEYPGSDDMRADRFPNSRLKGKGTGSAVKTGSGMSGSQGTMRKMPRLDHDGNDEANYEVDEAGIPGSVPAEKIPGKEDLLKGKGRSYYESAEEGNASKKVFKDKSGKPVGEIGIDPESSPGNGEWYVYHYGTGYSVVGFDSAAEAKRELLYVHKHPEAVEGHESTFNEAGIPGNVPAEKIPGKEALLKGRGRSYYEAQAQKKNSEEVNEGQRLHQGDPIVVTGPNEFEGKTGEIAEFSPSGKFVVVNLYNHGRHSMHLNDVEYNDYADQEEDDWYDDADEFGKPGSEFFPEGFQDFNKIEPYAVCLAGKPVKTFDYYEDARRFHDNWKKKLYREGDKAKADKITLMPLNLDEEEQKPYNPNEFRPVGPITIVPPKKLKSGETHQGINDYWKAHGQAPIYKTNEAGSPAQQAAIAIAMKKAHKKPKHVDESERDFRSIILKVMSKVFVDGGGGNLSYMIELKAPTMTALRAKYHDDLDAMFAKADPKELKQAAAELSAMFSKQVAEAGSPAQQAAIASAGKQLSVQQLATISDAALDSAYGYGRSQPGNTFGWQANLKSAAFAKQMIDKGITDVESISDAIHKGWNVTAQAFVKNPMMFDDSKTMAPEKLQAKVAQRQKLMTQQYAQLPEDEKEKDRVVARAMLQAITGGQQGVAEGQQPMNRNAVIQKLETIYTKLYQHEDPESYDLPAAVDYWHSLPADQLAMEFEDAIAKLKQSRSVTEDTGSWIVYDPKTRQIKKRFKTHTAGKSYAKTHKLGFASSEYYFDNVKLAVTAEGTTDYQKRRQRERDVDAGKPVAKQRQPKMTDYQKRRAQQKKELELGEESSTSSDAVERAILNRIMVAHTDLLMKFGPEKVMQAAEEVAYNVGDVDEIGTSDVSAYVDQVKQILGVPEELDEKWSEKYKRSIDCSHPKGFSQRAHCAGKKK